MKHIVSLSGGKDSTAMLLMMLEKNMQVDEIFFCDTGMEFPEMYEHLEKLNSYIKANFNKEITFLSSEKSFEHYMFHHKRTRGKHINTVGYGWANHLVRWCTSNLKRDVIRKYLKGKEYILYIGIAADEPKRHERAELNVRHPLFEWGVTERQALSFCYEHGFDWGVLRTFTQNVLLVLPSTISKSTSFSLS